jgi:hypothetical protein
MICTIEEWAKKIHYIEEGSDFEENGIKLSRTDHDYYMEYSSGKTYSVNIREYENAIKFLILPDFVLYCYFADSPKRYRFNFESQLKSIVIKFEMMRTETILGEWVNCLDFVNVMIDDHYYYYTIRDFLKHHPEYEKALMMIKENITTWVQYSEENRLSYLYEKWKILRDFSWHTEENNATIRIIS